MEGKLFNVRQIYDLHYYELSRGFARPAERHDHWEMLYVDKGEVTAFLENDRQVIRQGEMIFHKPGEFHTHLGNHLVSNLCVVGFLCKSPAMIFFKDKLIKLPLGQRGLISMMMSERGRTAPGSAQLLRLYLEQLMIMLYRSTDETSAENPVNRELNQNRLVSDMIDYMESKVFGRLTIGELCEHLHYGKTFLSELFKKQTGESIMGYYNKLKILRARLLIREEKYNFTQVSNLLMFDNPQYFSKTFKRVTGMTPREYANSIMVDIG